MPHPPPASDSPLRRSWRSWLRLPDSLGLLAALGGALLVLLLSQLPARHVVDIGGYDAAYVQGFHDPEYRSAPGSAPPYLAGSDGSARWSRASSFLLFPQAGLPAEVTLRLRGWRATPAADLPQVRLLLNGREELATFRAGTQWQEHRVTISGGLLKASDVLLEIQSTTATLPGDDRAVGVLLDRATYHVPASGAGLIAPYPTQVLSGGLVGLLLWWHLRALPRRQQLLGLVLGALLVGGAFALLVRQPPPYPYPLRWLLPGLVGLLLALALLRAGSTAIEHIERRPWLLDGLALAGVGLWLGRVLLAAQEHVTLSVPGVEKDFRVFATRTDSLTEVFHADGFYNLGYPLLLWLATPLTSGNPFLAGRLLAALSGALLLLAGYWLARTLLADYGLMGRLGALLALWLLATSSLVVQYGLYVGSDMPFAALVTLTLALLAAATTRAHVHRIHVPLLLLAGVAAGAAFLVRHLGLVLLLWGVLYTGFVVWHAHPAASWRARLRLPLLFAGGFVLLALPQLVVNTLETGQPLYNQQAKNVWLAVYANTDWGRWHEAPNSIGMAEVVLRDPGRFAANWWRNMQGFVGSGAEDTSEFGRALQLRLLGWPANWLAVAGLASWAVVAARQWSSRRHAALTLAVQARASLLLLVGGYVLVLAMAFVLPRFVLPLVAVYALGAAWLLVLLARWGLPSGATAASWRRLLLAGLLLLALLWQGPAIATRYVLNHQPPDEVAIIQATMARLQPGETVLARLPAEVPIAKYSALAHRVQPWPAAGNTSTLTQARNAGAAYLLWDETAGPPPLPDPAAARVVRAGPYALYALRAIS